jgi:hypothetical protein
MPKKGPVTDPERLKKLEQARKKSLETRRRNKALKEQKKKEQEQKAAKYDEMMAGKNEVEETVVNTDDPISARAKAAIPRDEDPNVVNHVSQSRFGESPEEYVLPQPELREDFDLNEKKAPPASSLDTNKEVVEKTNTNKEVVEEEEEYRSSPDLFRSEEEYLSDESMSDHEQFIPIPKKKKHKSKKKKKHIKRVKYYSSSSSDDSDGEIIIRRKKPKKNVLYYEDLEEYMKMKNNVQDKTVAPTFSQVEPKVDEQQKYLREQLDLAKASLFTL